MMKFDREGVDTRIAFGSASKRLLPSVVPFVAHAHPAAVQSPGNDHPAAAQAEPLSAPALRAVSSGTFRRATKALLRRTAKAAFRLGRPFARPLAFRMRSFFVADVRRELSQIHQSMVALHADTARRMHDAQMLAAQAGQVHLAIRQNELLEAMAKHDQLVMGLMQEVQSARSFIEHDVARVQAALEGVAAQLADGFHEAGTQSLATLMQVRDELAAPSPELIGRLDRLESYAYAVLRRHAAVPCGDEVMLLSTESGYILCDDKDTSLIACLMDSGELERGTRLLIQSILRPGDIFIDIGANVGLHSMAAARAMAGRGRIFAFEPFPRTAALLERSALANGYGDVITVRPVAVSSRSGSERLFLGGTSGHHSLYPLSEAPSSASVDAKLVTLDEDLHGITGISLIKIDVEGAELDVIAGAGQVLAANPEARIIVEFGMSHLTRNGMAVAEWFGVFTHLGYRWQVIDALSGSLSDATFADLALAPSVNLLFTK